MALYRQALILDDHQLFAAAFAELLRKTEKFEAVHCSNSLFDTTQVLASNKVDHFFTDYIMPGINTLSEIKALRTKYPGLLIIVVSTVTNGSLVFQMQKAGANGFISKNANVQEIEECLEITQTGKFFVSYNVRGEMQKLVSAGKDDFFTPREHEILQHIAAGSTIEDTAAKLHLSRHTVVAHRRNMMEKMEVNSVSSLLKKAMDLGML